MYESLVYDLKSKKPTRKLVLAAAKAIETLSREAANTTDKISLMAAVKTDAWSFVWAAEPHRNISVQMTYDDLWRLVNDIRIRREDKGDE